MRLINVDSDSSMDFQVGVDSVSANSTWLILVSVFAVFSTLIVISACGCCGSSGAKKKGKGAEVVEPVSTTKMENNEALVVVEQKIPNAPLIDNSCAFCDGGRAAATCEHRGKIQPNVAQPTPSQPIVAPPSPKVPKASKVSKSPAKSIQCAMKKTSAEECVFIDDDPTVKSAMIASIPGSSL